MSLPIRVRIEGQGRNLRGWRIVDAETGRPIAGVVAVSITAGWRSDKAATATIELLEFDLDAEVEATAKRFGLGAAPRPTRSS